MTNPRHMKNSVNTQSMSAEAPRSLSRTLFSQLLAGLTCGALFVACAPPTTPPESSPVYAEKLAPAVEPTPITASSTQDPEIKDVEPTSGNGEIKGAESVGENGAADGDEAATDKAEGGKPEEKAAPKTESKEPSSEEAPNEAAPEKKEKAEPVAPAKKKSAALKKAGGAQAGCTEGSCG